MSTMTQKNISLNWFHQCQKYSLKNILDTVISPWINEYVFAVQITTDILERYG